jgi:hypothetical protein
MAVDYLSIPGMCPINYPILDLTNPIATSVDVERVFSKGRLVLSHVRNGLSVQSTRALMCLGAWSRMDLVKDKDVMEAARLPDVDGSEPELDSDWDEIVC